MKNFLILACLLVLTACSSSYNSKYSKSGFGSKKAPTIYRVKKGDTLFSIAWVYGLDPQVIQRRNNISNPNKIFIGQSLRLKYSSDKFNKKKSHTKYSAKKAYTSPRVIANWVWPMKGTITRGFNPKRIGANGIRIAGRPNQTVNAAEAGTVAYKGNGLNGYGNVVIIKHKNGLLSAYGFLSKTYVKEGQKVKKRQRIGTVGYAANKKLMLHFEVRRSGKPVNPTAYISSKYRF